MVLKISNLDLGPEELERQLPLICDLIRMMPGSDRPDYWLARLRRPIVAEGARVRHLILGARLVDTRIGKGMGEIGVNLAYVMDETLLDDARLDFSKCHSVAIGFARRLVFPLLGI